MTRSLAWIGVLVLALGVSAAGCGDDDSGTGATGGDAGSGGDGGDGGAGGQGGSPPPLDATATIVRTSLGIPHITADDFAGLGYGTGYAYAQDNYCVLMREIVFANGESARWLGESEGDPTSDYIYTFFNNDDYIRNEFIASATENLQEVIRGYAAGMNRYLAETGVDNLPAGPEGCRGADWVRDITNVDLAKVYRKLIVRAGIESVASLIMAADDVAPTQSTASLALDPLESSPFNPEVLGIPEPTAFGSNAYGVGSEGSQTDYGILLGNPHFPWRGPERWYVQHLIVPGEYDVMGASLQGIPVVNIGFNNDLAWSHTVSTAQRFGFFELDLLADNPYQYNYDDEVRDIEVNPVTIEVMLEDGTLEERTSNIYMTQYGPIVNLGGLSELVAGWPTQAGTVFAMRDANIDNTRILDQFTKMGQSTSIDELEDALKDIGLPWVNTIAADRDGTGYYADVSTVPNVSQEQLANCADSIYTIAITNLGVAAINGSRSECEWSTDSDGPPGLLGFDNLPKLRTGPGVEYVSNSNDSYWLSNPNELLENFSPLMGRNGFDPPERIQQSLRTRQGFVQAEERLTGTDGLGDDPGFNIDNMRDLMFQNRNIAGELARAEVVAICDDVDDWSAGDCGGSPYSANPTEAAEACTILEDWDGLFNNDSVGPALWRNVWFRVDDAPNLWSVPFDADDPVNTPNGFNESDAGVIEATRCAIGSAVDFLVAEGIPLDRPWGEVQFRFNGDRTEQIPVHGGSGGFMWSVISSNFVEGEGYSNIPTGNSYIQSVTWDETDCPDAWGTLTYSQSTDPESPHYSDWTELFSEKVWNDMPYCPDDIEADTVSEIVISTDD
ncbi:MAG: penicillin acylase family protein [Myxococcota bacterium]